MASRAGAGPLSPDRDVINLTCAPLADGFSRGTGGGRINIDQLCGQKLFDRPASHRLFKNRLLNDAERGKIDAAGPVLLVF